MSRRSIRQGALAKGCAAFSVALALGLGLAPASIAIADESQPSQSELTALEAPVEAATLDEPVTEPTETAEPEPLPTETVVPAPVEPAPAEPVEVEPAPAVPSVQATRVEPDLSETLGSGNDPDPAAESESELDGDVSPMAVGPDGATPPYIYWDVRDVDTGELVSGASFEWEC